VSDPLDEFYESCRCAPVPSTLYLPPRRIGMLAPALGLCCGLAIACAMIVSIPEPDPLKGRDAAAAIGRLQLAQTTEKVPSRASAERGASHA
jgi:hypothetical protein